MTILELIAKYPGRFLAQTWYTEEPFASVAWPPSGKTTVPTGVTMLGQVPPATLVALVPTIQLLYTFLDHPRATIWEKYLWTSDTDSLGQRVFIGKNNGLMEIHRHLAINDRWGVPTWTTA